MKYKNKYNKDLMEFLDGGVSPYHAVESMKKRLEKSGYTGLDIKESWSLNRGGKYYVDLGTTLIGFAIGENADRFRILGSHTDSPTFLIKPNADIQFKNYQKLNTETYGGPILNTWLDRPLSVAGRVDLKGDSVFETKAVLVDFEEPVAIIPNLAIHQNRTVNQGLELNKQKDMLPIIGLSGKKLEEEYFLTQLSKKINCKKEDILSYECYFYPVEKASFVGFLKEMISSGRLDNLSMFYTNFVALMETKAKNAVNVAVGFDNEEVGSGSRLGAGSVLLSTVLERIAQSMGITGDDYYAMIQKSFMISCDMAHAIHPNTPEKTDVTNHPKLNEGPVIKTSFNKKYSSTSYSTSVFMQLCKKAGVPCQQFVNRSDQAGGSTIGPISARELAIESVDIGNPMLSMHSSRELMGSKDTEYLILALKVFFQE